jgi:hypothetical protein
MVYAFWFLERPMDNVLTMAYTAMSVIGLGRSTRLWDVKDPTLSGQSADSRRCGGLKAMKFFFIYTVLLGAE